MPHKPRQHRPRTRTATLSTHQSGGKSPYDRAWRNTRRAYLARNPVCAGDNCQQPAHDVDHITPLADGGAKHDFANLQGFCKSCHSKKTRQDQNQKRP